ncbi:MAG: restriction endonuclease, partial [Bacteroidales bacterium]|nr:restriction endonuclease [Bacteroidales bacterium]
ADRSSSVDVEQILGRVLRMPWVRRNRNAMLNMSYVLTSSPKFLDTLDNIVKGLNRAGFSEQDYRIAEPEGFRPEKNAPLVENDLFAIKNRDGEPVGNTPDELDASKIAFSAQAEGGHGQMQSAEKEPPKNINVDEIEKRALEEAERDERAERKAANGKNNNVPTDLGMQVKKYKMKEMFCASAMTLKLPQFVSNDRLSNEFFEELHQSALFESEMLLKDFKLGSADSTINFDSVETSMYRVDLDENNRYMPTYLKVEGAVHEQIASYILAPEHKKNRIKNCTHRLKNIIGKMYPIPDREIEMFVNHVLERFTDEQFADLLNHEYSYAEKIKQKIRQLGDEFKESQFYNMVDKDQIFTESLFQLPTEIIPSKTISGLPKSLYEKEADMDGFEREVINDVANLDSVEFWTRNLERGKGFCINGFINHYPDFIIKTKKGKIVLLETKGDHLDDEKKIKLGNLWESKAGNQFRYCLVYKNRKVEGAYTKNEFLEILKEL